IYDDFYWYTHFSDINFVYGRALAQTVGTSVMRLADAEVLPFDFVDFADTVDMYRKNLEKLLADKQEEIRERNQELDEGMFKATFDPRRPTVAPVREEVPPHLNFAPMQNAVDSVTRSAKHYQQALSQKQASLGDDAVTGKLGALNRELMESERRLTNADGLPRRPWYKHLLYAPGVYTGYGVKTVPGVREGIEQKRYAEAEQEIVRVAKALEDEAAVIESAARQLEGAGREAECSAAAPKSRKPRDPGHPVVVVFMKRPIVPWKPMKRSRASPSFSSKHPHSRPPFGLRQSPTQLTTGRAAYRPPRKLPARMTYCSGPWRRCRANRVSLPTGRSFHSGPVPKIPSRSARD